MSSVPDAHTTSSEEKLADLWESDADSDTDSAELVGADESKMFRQVFRS